MQISNSPPRLSVTVAAAVRAEMARRRVSQLQLADRLGWSQPKISRRLTDGSPFTLDEIPLVADALGTTAEDLIAASLAARNVPVAA